MGRALLGLVLLGATSLAVIRLAAPWLAQSPAPALAPWMASGLWRAALATLSVAAGGLAWGRGARGIALARPAPDVAHWLLGAVLTLAAASAVALPASLLGRAAGMAGAVLLTIWLIWFWPSWGRHEPGPRVPDGARIRPTRARGQAPPPSATAGCGAVFPPTGISAATASLAPQAASPVFPPRAPGTGAVPEVALRATSAHLRSAPPNTGLPRTGAFPSADNTAAAVSEVPPRRALRSTKAATPRLAPRLTLPTLRGIAARWLRVGFAQVALAHQALRQGLCLSAAPTPTQRWPRQPLTAARALALTMLVGLLLPALLAATLPANTTTLVGAALAPGACLAVALWRRTLHWRALAFPAPRLTPLGLLWLAAVLVGLTAAAAQPASVGRSVLPYPIPPVVPALILATLLAVFCFGFLQTRAMDLWPPLPAATLAAAAFALGSRPLVAPDHSWLLIFALGLLAAAARSLGGAGGATLIVITAQVAAWLPALLGHP